jgi:hypothetical protein
MGHPILWLNRDMGHPPPRFCGFNLDVGPEEDVILEVESEDVAMGGIQFLTDEKGRKTAAVIDLKVHKALWEDIQDVLVSKARRHEKGVSLDKVKAGLIASGKLRG